MADVLRIEVRRELRGEVWPEHELGGGAGLWRCPETPRAALLSARVATEARMGSGLVLELDEDLLSDYRRADGWAVPLLKPSGGWPVLALVSVRVQVASLLEELDVVIGVSTVDDGVGRHYETALACAHAIADDMRSGAAAKPMRDLLRWCAEDHARRAATARPSSIARAAPPPN